jgi:hypothetical protein
VRLHRANAGAQANGAFQPADRSIQLGQRHFSPALVATRVFEGDVIPVVTSRSCNATSEARPPCLVLDGLPRVEVTLKQGRAGGPKDAA